MFRPFLIALAGTSAALMGVSPAAAWGPIGHRITGQIAQDNLSGHTRAHVERILGHELLAEASTRPDEERSNPAPFWQETASAWHYVTLPVGVSANQLAHPPEGDAITALERFTAVLRDHAADQEDKALALRFVVHIVGDLHMPLHVGREGDRGGSDVRVRWFTQPQNLHWVWDEGMILHQQLSFTEYAERLSRRATAEEVLEWWDPRPVTWIDESAELRERIYPPIGGELGEGTFDSPVSLSWDYAYQWTPTMEQRLHQAGIRIAAYLDWVFSAQE